MVTLSRPQGGRDVQSTAAALAARADAAKQSSPRALLSVLRTDAPSGDIVRVVTTDGHPIGETLRTGLWTTAVFPLHGGTVAATGIELSHPTSSRGGLDLGRAAAIVAGVLALLALLVAFRLTAGRPIGGDDERGRTDVNAPPPLSDSERRMLVGALMTVIETAPESPAGLRALRTLKQVGVTTIEPSHGAAFDSRLHCVCGVVDAPDPVLVDSVAAVVRPGYLDHGSVLREADVQIYGSTPDRRHALPAVS
jgi:hypothetical protein